MNSSNSQIYKITIPETGEIFIKSSIVTKKFQRNADRIGLEYLVECLH